MIEQLLTDNPILGGGVFATILLMCIASLLGYVDLRRRTREMIEDVKKNETNIELIKNNQSNFVTQEGLNKAIIDLKELLSAKFEAVMTEIKALQRK